MSVNHSTNDAGGDLRWRLFCLLCFSLLSLYSSSCFYIDVVVTLQRVLERTAVPKKLGKDGFPPYLYCQQGIMLFFCSGSKPFYCRLDQPRWVFSAGPGDIPITHCVDVWVQLLMPAHFICFAVGNHRLLKGKISPHCSLTIAATTWNYNYFFIYPFSLSTPSFLSLPSMLFLLFIFFSFFNPPLNLAFSCNEL